MPRLFAPLILALLFAATPAFAQDESSSDSAPAAGEEQDTSEEPSSDPFSEFEDLREEEGKDAIGEGTTPLAKPIGAMSQDELVGAGFEFGSETSSRDVSAAILLSATAGLAVHGVGHLYLGDRRTGYLLLGVEGASVGLMLSSAVFYGLTKGASPWTSAFAPALQLGIAGFVFSYLADLVGTLQGDDGKLAENSSSDTGVGFRARYGLVNAAGSPLRHAIDARLAADVGRVYGHAATTQDVFLDLASYRGGVGVRPFRGRARLTSVSLEGNGEYLQWQGDGEFGRISADGRLGLSYQLGRRFAHLSEFAAGLEAGLGNRWYQVAPRGTTTFATATSKLWVPFDAWASMNVSPRLNLKGGYGSPDLTFMAASQRLLGIAHLDLTYRSSSYGDISLRAEIGDGFVLWLGGGLWFGL